MGRGTRFQVSSQDMSTRSRFAHRKHIEMDILFRRNLELRERPLNCILTRGVGCLAGGGETLLIAGGCNGRAEGTGEEPAAGRVLAADRNASAGEWIINSRLVRTA